jgi:putative CocE/NonD family hydrolase
MAPYNNEGQDGFDTIEWITRQPWCSGRVGMMGGSYVGAVQWQAAAEHPPGLAAIAPQATWSSFYRNIYLGGAVRLALISSWIAGNTPKPAGVTPGDMNVALMRLPLSELDEAIGWPMPWLDAFLTHPEPNGFWTRLDLTSRLPELTLPVLHVVGYYDFFSRESVGNFMIMQQQARDPATRQQQRLILGPWDHGTVGKTKVAEVEFGAEAAVDTFGLQVDWFDRHLKQDAAARAKPFAPVRYFSMGEAACGVQRDIVLSPLGWQSEHPRWIGPAHARGSGDRGTFRPVSRRSGESCSGVSGHSDPPDQGRRVGTGRPERHRGSRRRLGVYERGDARTADLCGQH